MRRRQLVDDKQWRFFLIQKPVWQDNKELLSLYPISILLFNLQLVNWKKNIFFVICFCNLFYFISFNLITYSGLFYYAALYRYIWKINSKISVFGEFALIFNIMYLLLIDFYWDFRVLERSRGVIFWLLIDS